MPRRAYICLLGLLPALSGCLHVLHETPKADPCVFRASDRVAPECKSCVYLFIFDPLDPLTWAHTKGLRDYAHSLGFGKVYYGQSPHTSYFLEKMRMIRGHCDSSRFVVIGYHSGADAAKDLAERAAAEGMMVDAAIFLEPKGDGDWASFPMATSTLTVRAGDLPPIVKHEDGVHPPRAAKKTDVPTHPQTLELIERELSLVAMTVPPPRRPAPIPVQLVDPMPAPRDVIPNPRPLSEEWRFIRPRHPFNIPPEGTRLPTETLPLPKNLPELPEPKERKEP